ncbi:MAG: XrtA/PEP-CTERM system histidine kinase PrsK [Cellvibrionaceae bacterium]
MPIEIGFLSHLFLAVTMLMMLLFIASKKIRTQQKIPLALVCLSTLLWSVVTAFDNNKSFIVVISESLRYASWFLLLLSVTIANGFSRSGLTPLLLSILILLSFTAYPDNSSSKNILFTILDLGQIKLLALVGINIIALGIIEQITRNSNEQERWKLKYILVGAGAIFTYDFCMHSDALMFQETNELFKSSRGLINALITPILFIGINRLGSREFNIHISKNVVFHSATVITAACYLLLLAAAGYYVRYINESLGGLFLLIFIFGGALILATLLLSVKLRQYIKVVLNKHFFGLKHDYRKQWLDFTHNLANSEGQVPIRVCQSMSQLIGASGALLWKKQQNQLAPIAHWHIPEPNTGNREQDRSLQSLVRFMEETEWVIDLDEYRESRSVYGTLEIPKWILSISKCWLIVPLLYQNSVLGIVLLRRSDLSRDINWEDRDLLKLAGQQAAIHLSQYESERELVEARQFEAYHRLSTYVMHDLKNILAQQSLLVANAEKHKSNPDFVNDMLSTIANSVDRMTRLLKQMKSGERNDVIEPVLISDALGTAIKNLSNKKPTPNFNFAKSESAVDGDKAQLITIFEHMIQNAQDATPNSGSVNISVDSRSKSTVIKISDTGSGMSAEFLKHRLFKPFDTTKGLAGMGIGVFESRQTISALGGDLEVESKVGVGSEFTITLPSYIVSAKDNEQLSTSNSTQLAVQEIKEE